MYLKKKMLGLVAASLALVTFSSIAAADEYAYTEGAVSVVTSVQTMPGRFDDYMQWLDTGWKKQNEALKQAGVILNYAVYNANPRTPNDPDLYLVITYKNMAALDDLNAKTDPISEKLFGSQQQQTAATIDREKIRKILGTELIRELKLK